MKFKVIIVFFLLLFTQNSNSENDSGYAKLPTLDEIFYIGKMDSHNNDFVLFFKTREKAILARGEEFNYVTDYPQDLYIYDRKTKNYESELKHLIKGHQNFFDSNRKKFELGVKYLSLIHI